VEASEDKDLAGEALEFEGAGTGIISTSDALEGLDLHP
jgi:hypothetical protein